MLELKQQVLSGATGESTDTQTSVLFLLSALQGLFTLLVNFVSNFINFALNVGRKSCRYSQQSKRFEGTKEQLCTCITLFGTVFFFFFFL